MEMNDFLFEEETAPGLTHEGVACPSSDGPGVACGLEGMSRCDPGTVAETHGMIVKVGGEVFDLGHPGEMAGTVTLADDRGMSIFADRDGDGAVDRVTTMLYDGTWETWSDGGGDNPDTGGVAESEMAAWERIEAGRWG